jgi:pyruvate ferredoxin oxidoreductase alpha subunit
MSTNNQPQILEGSHAIALTIHNINPAVISAYPITPQTHIVEDLANLKAAGTANYEYVRAESEFAAASIVLGASATGVRVYSATSSQGLLLMTEVLYNIAGMRLPVVMTCANRAISAPINIWNDHSDVMSVRDAGWIQLFAGGNQEAVNQHILAYRLAEQLNLPVMVNVDGFILTHSYDSVVIPDREAIKKYLPDYQPTPGQYLNPHEPVTLGGFFTPAHYLETRESLHQDLLASQATIKQEYKNFQKIFRSATHSNSIDNGLAEYYGPKKAKIVLVALGSVTGTIREALKKQPQVGLIKIKVYRPFPAAELNKFLVAAQHIAVIEKAISLGQAGPLYTDLAAGLTKKAHLKNYIVGLGGRDVTVKMINQIIKDTTKNNTALKFIGQI